MKPVFRTDLVCSREEQQGVVFYRIDDPKSQTNFRLYEIEYLIAKKLDGSRALSEVIQAVKKEYNFDITEPDLQRFVNQLESMGFIVGARDGKPAQTETVTRVMTKTAKSDELDLVDADALVDDAPPAAKGELDRLLRSALLHVKQGYIAHARDYFLAAKEMSPGDERLVKLVNHLEIIGDTSGPAEVEYLWNQARQLFPDVAAAVGPLADAKIGGPSEAALGRRRTTKGDAAAGDSVRARVWWALLILGVLVVGGGALYWVVRTAGIFAGPAPVRVAVVSPERVAVYHDEPATAVTAAGEAWLVAAQAGKVGRLEVAAGARVRQGQLLLAMDMPPKDAKQLDQAQAAAVRAGQAYDKARAALEELHRDIESAEEEGRLAEEKLKEVQPQKLEGGAQKRSEMERLKQARVSANTKLTRLKKALRKPRAQEARAKKLKEQADKRWQAVEKRLGDKILRAGAHGVVVEVRVKVGDKIGVGDKLVLLRDTTAVGVVFEIDGRTALQVGGEAQVAAGRASPSAAKVTGVRVEGARTRIETRLPDPGGNLWSAAPSEFRLLREQADDAFRLPASAVVKSEQGPRVMVVVNDHVAARGVELLGNEGQELIVRGGSGSLRAGDRVVLSRLDDRSLDTLNDGVAVQVKAP